MKNIHEIFRRSAMAGVAILLSACAGVGGADLKSGSAAVPDVIAALGEPAMVWKDGSGREQLAYPRGPSSSQSFMVFIGADGRLERIEQVINSENFARIKSGASDEEAVQRILGPSLLPPMLSYARNELAWEWRYMNILNQRAFFGVLFDASTGLVRTTYQRREYPKLFD